MDSPDDTSLVYAPDYGLDSADSDGTFFDTDSSNDTMSTLTSGEVAEYFHSVHGYTYTSDENLPLVFPVVPSTVQLNVLYHTLVRLCQDGQNVPPEADEVLRAGGVNPRLSTGARVLDVITNCGTWVQEMAEEYPSARFLSIDVKPLLPFDPHPRIAFEVYDVYAGIAEPDATFDVVHARQCVTTTKNFNFLLREMHRVLKPNGILVVTEIPTQGYEWSDPNKILQSAPRRAHGLRLFRRALKLQGIDLGVWEDLSARLEPTHSLWTERTIDPAVGIVEDLPKALYPARGFQSIKQRTRLIPSGPWPDDEAQRLIGSLARFLFTNTWRALIPLMIIMGMDEGDVRRIVDGILEEFGDNEIKGYLKCQEWTARRI
ncbi:hypothetical protein FRC09_013099 [Ceratobasidium sp. 395]|nr:hypothetical protein FRC09_013099 [Ceratobasidium sp. 395]